MEQETPVPGGITRAVPPLPKQSLLRSGSALSLLTLVSRVLGLLREMTKAALLGTSALSDAFSVAFLIPNLFRRLFAEGSISAAFVPTFKGFLLENDPLRTREFLSCFFTFLSFFVSLAVAAGILAAPLIVPVFGRAEFDETVFLTRLMFPFLCFISIAAFFQGILNSVHVFLPSSFAPVILNIVTIACAWLLHPYTKNPARAIAIGILAGGFLEAAVQAPFVLKNGFRFFFTGLKAALRNSGTRTVLRLIAPTIIGMAAYQLNDIVSTALARRAGAGVVSSLQYSLRLQELMLGVFAVSIGTVLLPGLAEYAKLSKWDLYNKRLSGALDVIALITIPVTFFSLAEGETIIRLLFQSLAFDEASVRLTLEAFNFHIAGLYFIALNRVIAPAFYARSDAASPAAAGVFSFAVNIALAALLAGPMRGGGIALALSLSGAANTAALFFLFNRKAGASLVNFLPKTLGYALKITAFSVAAVIPVLFFNRYPAAFLRAGGANRLVSFAVPLFIALVIFAATGLALLAVTKDRNIRTLLAALSNKRRGLHG
ncbi:MAG: murein biosynthesis integral membrane protein MurJ [Spirochaetaceae bacterium]|jgi:putative peptidoglycan lipid II flippase|nr:murein biosynthesis integral membrane protein MurJ [Spirochaetaceae bacterium]